MSCELEITFKRVQIDPERFGLIKMVVFVYLHNTNILIVYRSSIYATVSIELTKV